MDVQVNARLRGGLTLQGGTSTGRVVNDTCDLVIDNPSQYNCHKVFPFQTEIRGLAIYTVPKINVQVSGTLQSRPGPEITAMWNVPASLIAQSLGRAPSGGVANVQTNILTAGELYGDRVTQVDMRIAKLLKFGRMRTNVGVDVYNLFNSNVPLGYVTIYGRDLAQPELGPRCALCENQCAVRFLIRKDLVKRAARTHAAGHFYVSARLLSTKNHEQVSL